MLTICYEATGKILPESLSLSLADGSHTLNITETIDGILESITGGNGEVVSFVSENNTNVKSVQFVIQTEKIKITEQETYTETVKEKLNFWQKILRFFGLY